MWALGDLRSISVFAAADVLVINVVCYARYRRVVPLEGADDEFAAGRRDHILVRALTASHNIINRHKIFIMKHCHHPYVAERVTFTVSR